MVEIYEKKGFTREEAETVLTIMARHKDFFVDHMMVQELGLMPIHEDDSPVKQGLVMFGSFMLFGFIPLLAYVALDPINWPDSFDPIFLIACILTALSLFVLGAIKSKFSVMVWWKSGLWVLLNGGIAAVVAFLTGYLYVLSAGARSGDRRCPSLTNAHPHCSGRRDTQTFVHRRR
jgi:VIT1/CCC1 family predicted Fe2+/Mn2+ transporter